MDSRERVLRFLEGKQTDCLPCMPITMMFACDRIGAVYRDYCTDFRVLAEGQLRTAEAFGFDYVNTMSDPAREAADCGAKVAYFDHQPVAIVEEDALLADKTRLATLKTPDPLGGGRMYNGIRAVELLRTRAGKDLIVEGWVEGPIAEAADLRGINTLMMDFFDDPAFVRDLFTFIVEMELNFAREQVRAGADVIGIGDAAASLISGSLYQEFVWPYEKQLIDGIHSMGARTRLHICGNTRQFIRQMGLLKPSIIDLDSLVPMREAREATGPDQVLLGNINPVAILKNGTVDTVTQAISACHQQAGNRYVVGAGCEIPRGTPDENVKSLSAYARSHSHI